MQEDIGVLQVGVHALGSGDEVRREIATIELQPHDNVSGRLGGGAFFHRTGHGIGLDGHEDPYLVAGNDMPLAAGMAFSVEPGIYYAGEYGARIEDIVVCGEDGPIVLNEAPREVAVVPG